MSENIPESARCGGDTTEIRTAGINEPLQGVGVSQIPCRPGYHIEVYQGVELELQHGDILYDGDEIEVEDGISLREYLDLLLQVRDQTKHLQELRREKELKLNRRRVQNRVIQRLQMQNRVLRDALRSDES